MSEADDTDTQPARPLLQIVRGGEPTEDEIAAVVAVLLTVHSGADAAESAALRPSLSAWVASGLVKGTRTKA